MCRGKPKDVQPHGDCCFSAEQPNLLTMEDGRIGAVN